MPRLSARVGEGASSHLVLGQLGHLGGLLVALHPHSQQATKQVIRHLKRAESGVGEAGSVVVARSMTYLELREYVRKAANAPQHLSHHPVCPAQRGIDLRAHPDEAAGNGEHQVVLLREQGHDAALDRLAGQLAILVGAKQVA